MTSLGDTAYYLSVNRGELGGGMAPMKVMLGAILEEVV